MWDKHSSLLSEAFVVTNKNVLTALIAAASRNPPPPSSQAKKPPVPAAESFDFIEYGEAGETKRGAGLLKLVLCIVIGLEQHPLLFIFFLI